MKAINYTIPYKLNQPLKIGLFSDLHLDSPECDLKILQEDFKKCEQEQRYMLFGGDMFDLILESDKKRHTPSRDGDGEDGKRDDQVNAKLEKGIELLKPYVQLIMFMGRGNHEESIIKHNQTDIIDLLIKVLNAYKQNGSIEKGNYENFIRFSFTKGKSYKAAMRYDILQHHGAGGNSPVTKGMIDFNRLIHGVDCDLVWIGHKHNALQLNSDPLMKVDTNNHIVLKNRQAIMTPSYSKGRTIDYNVNFAERFYTHQSLSGYGSIDLTPRKDSLDIDVSLKVKPSSIIGNIKNVKTR